MVHRLFIVFMVGGKQTNIFLLGVKCATMAGRLVLVQDFFFRTVRSRCRGGVLLPSISVFALTVVNNMVGERDGRHITRPLSTKKKQKMDHMAPTKCMHRALTIAYSILWSVRRRHISARYVCSVVW